MSCELGRRTNDRECLMKQSFFLLFILAGVAVAGYGLFGLLALDEWVLGRYSAGTGSRDTGIGILITLIGGIMVWYGAAELANSD